MAIREAFESSFVPLTGLCATINAYSEPANPKDLWESEIDRFVH